MLNVEFLSSATMNVVLLTSAKAEIQIPGESFSQFKIGLYCIPRCIKCFIAIGIAGIRCHTYIQVVQLPVLRICHICYGYLIAYRLEQLWLLLLKEYRYICKLRTRNRPATKPLQESSQCCCLSCTSRLSYILAFSAPHLLFVLSGCLWFPKSRGLSSLSCQWKYLKT